MVDTTAERALASFGLSAETKFRLIGRLPPARIASSRARASESAGCSSTGTRATGPSAALIGNTISNPSTSVEKINSFRIALLHLISCLPVDFCMTGKEHCDAATAARSAGHEAPALTRPKRSAALRQNHS